MNTGKLTSAFAICIVMASPAMAGEELLLGPVPDWVEPRSVEPPTGIETEQPVRALYVDNQVRLEDGRRSIFSSYALQFQTAEGLSAGNLTFGWSPDTDDLTVHKVVIHRGGEKIDVLGGGQTFTILRREQNLEMAMLDGVLTANLFPEGLQVGDILEVATTVTENSPVIGDHDEVMLGPFNGTMDRVHARIMWPQDETIRLAKSPGFPEWKRSRKGGFETAELTLLDLQPTPPPKGAPTRFAMRGLIEATDFATWSDLAAHFAPLYRQAATLPADGPLRAEVEAIRAASADPVVRAEAALKLVQGRIRYVALAMGEGGLVPSDAAMTWSRRYGDCKGKTALLLAILADLGIEAEPVFANTLLGDAVADRLPMIAMFNHVLVRARINGTEYWLDGTRTGDTSLARLRTPAFAWGLPVVSGGAELVRMVPAALELPNEDLAIHFDGSNGLKAPVPAKLEATFRGDSAIGTNQFMAGLVGESRDRALREYWRDRFDFIEPQKVSYAFDEATGEARIALEGVATLDWDGVWYETDESRVGYQADFKREAGPGQDAPFAVVHPFYNRTMQTIVLPAGINFSGNNYSSGAEVSETVAGIEYRRHASIENDKFTLETTARSIAPEFPASDAPAFEKRLRELRDRTVHLRLPNNYRGPEADQALAAAAVPSDNVRDLINEGSSLIDAGDYDAALARLTRATELAPADATAWADRGIALAYKGMFDEATVDLNRAAAIEPRSAVMFRGRGIIAERKQDFPAAIAAFTTAIEIEPSSSFAWGHRAMAHFYEKQPEKALADATEATKINPNYVDMYSLRSFLLQSQGKPDAALKEVEALLAANPDNPYAASTAARMYESLGKGDQARLLIQQVAADRPTPQALYDRAWLRDPSDISGKLADLDEALRLEPRFFLAMSARARLRAANGDPDGALEDIRNALVPNPKQRELYLLTASIARNLGRNDEAAAAAEGLATALPDSSPALVDASRIYASIGMYENAVAMVDKAMALSPEPFLYLDRSAARDPADFDARLADIDAALKRSPNFGDGLAAKAQLLADKGDIDGAVRTFGQALALEPKSIGLIHSRAIVLARAGRQREADRDFAQARTFANQAGAAALNGICYIKATANVALDKALAECEASLRLQPDLAPTLDSRGTVLLRMGRFDDAIADFDKAIEKMPEMAESRYLRGVAKSMKGDAAGAQADIAAARAANRLGVEKLERDGFVAADTSTGGAD